MPYPPGVSASTPNAPWNQDEPEECEQCGGVYTEDGHGTVGEDDEFICRDCDAHWFLEDSEFCPFCGSCDIGGLPCPNDGKTMYEYEEERRAAEADRKYDAMKEDGRL